MELAYPCWQFPTTLAHPDEALDLFSHEVPIRRLSSNRREL